jgi:hypothetical protein
MTRLTLIPFLLTAALAAAQAHAECYADWKAKQNDPLRLAYGVSEIPDDACESKKAAARAVAPRLEQDGWTLLNILSTFGPEGLGERQGSAGEFFLRY